jgi:hypothetical protein
VPGDLTIGPDGTVYMTDSAGGGVYALRPGASSLDTIAPPGTFASPQTPVLVPSGRRLIVPDYSRGLASLDLATGAVHWLEKPRDLAANGVDGLYAAWKGLVAIQNGTTPRRVLWLDTDEELSRIRGWRVLEQATPRLGEPTHGVVVGSRFYFIGNSGWDRLDVDQTLVTTRGSTTPVILRLDLTTAR